MSNAQDSENGANDPESVYVIVTGDCGHHFAVPVARFDGSEFQCPTCGSVDRLDPRALEAAKAEIERQRAQGTLDDYNQSVSKHIAAAQGDKS